MMGSLRQARDMWGRPGKHLAGAGHGVMANIGRPARVIFQITIHAKFGPVARKGRSGHPPAYEPHSLEAGRLLSRLQSKP